MAARNARTQRTARGQPLAGGRLLRVGDLLAGKYRVERVLGEGGMGVVVAAHHELLDQRVAVKLLFQDVADREAQSRLLLEARAAAKIQSDHVARVVDVDTGADGLPFIVMELLAGADLCAVADARGALPRWVVVDYVLQALEGLAHAHARGVVHRDLKPSNLFLAERLDGTQIIKILDFGISKTSDDADPDPNRRTRELTGGRAVLGSPPYMSPEQIRSPKMVDHRADIWALGVVMYELLTNTMPFGGEEMQETFANVLERHPIPLRQLAHGVPEELEQVVFRCLAKRRDDRFPDVGALARALAPFGSGAWSHAAERVTATLARGAPDDVSSGLRMRRVPGEVLSSRSEELHGTASTVAASVRASAHRRRFVVLAILAPALLGVLIGGMAFLRARALRQQMNAAAASQVSAPEAAPPPPSDPGLSALPVAAPASGFVASSPGPAGSLSSASDAPPEAVAPGLAVATGATVAATGARKPMPAAATARKPSTSAGAASPAPAGATGRGALPAGLPMTRE